MARPQTPLPDVRPSLYDFAGGAPAILALTRAHHERCLADPELNHPFSHPGQDPHHIERLAAYLAEVLGGRRPSPSAVPTSRRCCACMPETAT